VKQNKLFASEDHDAGAKRILRLPADVKVDCILAGPYRYSLKHMWGPGPTCMFLMMNPSAADVWQTDATIAKCSRFARKWGYGSISVGNVCAYRATHSSELLKVADPVGSQNSEYIISLAAQAEIIIVAYGKLPGNLQRHATAALVLLLLGGGNMASKLHFLKWNKVSNCPAHPLYLPEDSIPLSWVRRETK
jgi:hypothetical protein